MSLSSYLGIYGSKKQMTKDLSAHFTTSPAHTIPKWFFFGEPEHYPATHKFWALVGKKHFICDFTDKDYQEALSHQSEVPVAVMKVGRRRWWWFRGEFYYHTVEDDDVLIVKGLILQKLERDKKRHNRALEALRRHETEEPD